MVRLPADPSVVACDAAKLPMGRGPPAMKVYSFNTCPARALSDSWWEGDFAPEQSLW
jgi:hypothetical protein